MDKKINEPQDLLDALIKIKQEAAEDGEGKINKKEMFISLLCIFSYINTWPVSEIASEMINSQNIKKTSHDYATVSDRSGLGTNG